MNKNKQKRFSYVLAIIFAFSTLFISWNSALAADQKLIDQIKDEYVQYEKKETDNYKQYNEQVTKSYENYKKNETDGLERFIKQTELDVQNLDRLLKQDIEQLEKKYGDNREYRDKIREYKNETNISRLQSALNKYKKETEPHHLQSLMWKYSKEITESHLQSAMWKYHKAITQSHLQSPMWHYRNAVSESYLQSPMWYMRNGSSSSYLQSPVWHYKVGNINKETLKKDWAELFKKEQEKLNQEISKAKEDIVQISKESRAAISRQKCETVRGILEQREKSLQSVSDLRQKYFGEGITFEPLIPDLGQINVFVNGEWLCFEQPPIVVNGNTLVPMRAIFEKLGANVEWHGATRSITAGKGSTNISFVIDQPQATVNGKSIHLDTPAQNVNGHSLVPVRFVSEALGAKVEWDGQTRTVFITTE